MRAYVTIRDQPHYRREAFAEGLKAAGFEVLFATTSYPKPGDVLVVWNRYHYFHDLARHFEQTGNRIVVAENGYLGRDEEGRQFYALAMGGHNGSGKWNVGGPERFAKLKVPLQPWKSGGKIVVRGQRGIGTPSMASPPNWHRDVANRLRSFTDRRIEVIPHPGEGAERDTAHETYLQDAHALVIWSSSVGVKALTMGIPVFYEAPHWICESAAIQGIERIEDPRKDDDKRQAAMERMAWAQWSVSEIATGEPFRHLL